MVKYVKGGGNMDNEKYCKISVLNKIMELNENIFQAETIQTYVKTFNRDGNFSPAQIIWLFKMFEKYEIEYEPIKYCFKMNLKKENNKEQLYTLKKEELISILHTISDEDVEFVIKILER